MTVWPWHLRMCIFSLITVIYYCLDQRIWAIIFWKSENKENINIRLRPQANLKNDTKDLQELGRKSGCKIQLASRHNKLENDYTNSKIVCYELDKHKEYKVVYSRETFLKDCTQQTFTWSYDLSERNWDKDIWKYICSLFRMYWEEIRNYF